MKRFYSLIIPVLLSFLNLQAQKPSIDTADFKEWPTLSLPTMTQDGKFAFYNIHDNRANVDTLVVQATRFDWKMNILNIKPHTASFAHNDKHLIYIDRNDSLFVLNLGSSKRLFIAEVTSYELPKKGDGNFLFYRPENKMDQLVLLNLRTSERIKFDNVESWFISDDERFMVFSISRGSKEIEKGVYFYDFEKKINKKILDRVKIEKAIFANNSSKFFFLAANADKNQKAIWYFNDLILTPIIEDNSMMKEGWLLDDLRNLNEDGTAVFFSCRPKVLPEPKIALSKNLNIWSYTDSKLQSVQLSDLSNPSSYLFVVNLKTNEWRQLESETEKYIPLYKEFGLIRQSKGSAHPSEGKWNPAFKSVLYLTNYLNGNKEELKDVNINNFKISPSGKYLIYYNANSKAYFSYNVLSKVSIAITDKIDVNWMKFRSLAWGRGIAGWSQDSMFVYIYDEFDIWKVDLSGRNLAENITRGFGRKHNLVFSFATGSENGYITFNTEIILNAFNPLTKDNGYYAITLRGKSEPKLRTLGPFVYDLSKAQIGSERPSSSGMQPLKSTYNDIYIVRRSSYNEYGNYYSTVDFKSFRKLSNIHPEKAYNWYKTELIHWVSYNGDQLDGILYKPEDFDSNKKYPVIFRYYDKKSDGLNTYITPGYLEAYSNVNIPYYVSNGYLIVAVDNNFKPGEIGQNVVDAVTSAADYLKKMTFVDSSRMGINGFSFGGFQTYFLVTHSTMFAAACTGGGQTDIISNFGMLRRTGVCPQETSQVNMGATLWERPDLYIKNSPIFNVSKVHTPLLILHNSQDEAVNFSQAIEFFTAMRRLGKRAWLLAYDGSSHGVIGEAMVDFGIRQKQFFDHYLKGRPAPIWMTRGIPASRKGIDTGFDYDLQMKTPGKGLTIEEGFLNE